MNISEQHNSTVVVMTKVPCCYFSMDGICARLHNVSDISEHLFHVFIDFLKMLLLSVLSIKRHL